MSKRERGKEGERVRDYVCEKERVDIIITPLKVYPTYAS